MSRRSLHRTFRAFVPVVLLAAVTVLVVLSLPWASSPSPSSKLPSSSRALAQRNNAPRLVVYSGRSEPLIKPLLDQFSAETGIDVVVRYGDTAQLAATIIEEGRRSPADIFFAQDAGALGTLSEARLLTTLPDELLNMVDARLRSPGGDWIGTSGRARVIVHNTNAVPVTDAPSTIWDLVESRWRGRIGWAPTNGSFQAFVTALRMLEGEQRATEWLQAMLANSPRVYPNNRAIVDAVIRGEIDVGLVNHYYLFQFIDQYGEQSPARNHYTAGDAGAIVNVAGVGILNNSANKDLATRFIEFLLTEEVQQYFTDNNFEYPVLVDSAVGTNELLLPLNDLNVPDIDLSNLKDLEGTLELLQKVGVL